MPKRILITGGPVHAHLDDVKIITNRFKGGLIAKLADQLSDVTDITYVCSKDAEKPKDPFGRINVIIHQGFEDYRKIVKEQSMFHEAIILGAAVANLIPADPIQGKFPSHNYKPGDIIPINFMIAPRVIDDIKKQVPVDTHLFGFKLLSGVDHKELIKAAYGLLLESKATAIIANDTNNLSQKYIVTKERAVHAVSNDNLATWLWQVINDQYYHTMLTNDQPSDVKDNVKVIKDLICSFKNEFKIVEEGMIFGTVAVRCSEGFLTTGRGKKELDNIVYVKNVDHKHFTIQATANASLNAPLLSHIFDTNNNITSIVHYHDKLKDSPEKIPTLPYAIPGTVRDSIRDVHGSFNITDHGCFLLFDKNRELVFDAIFTM